MSCWPLFVGKWYLLKQIEPFCMNAITFSESAFNRSPVYYILLIVT